jgi:hypothetical protein
MSLNRVAVFKVYNHYGNPGQMDSRWLKRVAKLTIDARAAGIQVDRVNRSGDVVDVNGHVWLGSSDCGWYDFTAYDDSDEDYDYEETIDYE